MSRSHHTLVCSQPPRPTQPGHPKVGDQNEYWWWSQNAAEETASLHNCRLCNHDCWQSWLKVLAVGRVNDLLILCVYKCHDLLKGGWNKLVWGRQSYPLECSRGHGHIIWHKGQGVTSLLSIDDDTLSFSGLLSMLWVQTILQSFHVAHEVPVFWDSPTQYKTFSVWSTSANHVLLQQRAENMKSTNAFSAISDDFRPKQ